MLAGTFGAAEIPIRAVSEYLVNELIDLSVDKNAEAEKGIFKGLCKA